MLLTIGELDVARVYCQRTADTNTFSGPDLTARVRLHMIDGDLPGAMKASRIRLERYESDYARRDLAAL
jgi:hypothetical protein